MTVRHLDWSWGGARRSGSIQYVHKLGAKGDCAQDKRRNLDAVSCCSGQCHESCSVDEKEVLLNFALAQKLQNDTSNDLRGNSALKSWSTTSEVLDVVAARWVRGHASCLLGCCRNLAVRG